MQPHRHALVQAGQLIILQRPNGDILMLKDSDGRWGLPGGRLNQEEFWIDGLRREVKEETGIEKFDLFQPLGIFQRESRSGGPSVYGVIFLGATDELEVILSHEHVAYDWFASLGDCDNKPFFPREVEALVRAVLCKK